MAAGPGDLSSVADDGGNGSNSCEQPETEVDPLRALIPSPQFANNGSIADRKARAERGPTAAPELAAVQDVNPISLPKSKKEWSRDDFRRLQVISKNDLEDLQLLGSGGFGTVHLGKWRGSKVAIKRIKEDKRKEKGGKLVANFWKEAGIIAQLRHPNVVTCYGVVLDDSGELEGIVTEYMIDGSLGDAIRKKDRIESFHTRALIALQAAMAMEYVHGKGVIHFDIKSYNLFVDLRDPQNPVCKIGDFGLSEFTNESSAPAARKGTRQWMAPELRGSGQISDKVDVYSFGIFMWELVTGEMPHADMSSRSIENGVLDNCFGPWASDGVDDEWMGLMGTCRLPDPSKRPTFTKIVSELNFIALLRNFSKKQQLYSGKQQVKPPPASCSIQVPSIPQEVNKKIERKDAEMVNEPKPVPVQFGLTGCHTQCEMRESSLLRSPRSQLVKEANLRPIYSGESLFSNMQVHRGLNLKPTSCVKEYQLFPPAKIRQINDFTPWKDYQLFPLSKIQQRVDLSPGPIPSPSDKERGQIYQIQQNNGLNQNPSFCGIDYEKLQSYKNQQDGLDPRRIFSGKDYEMFQCFKSQLSEGLKPQPNFCRTDYGLLQSYRIQQNNALNPRPRFCGIDYGLLQSDRIQQNTAMNPMPICSRTKNGMPHSYNIQRSKGLYQRPICSGQNCELLQCGMTQPQAAFNPRPMLYGNNPGCHPLGQPPQMVLKGVYDLYGM